MRELSGSKGRMEVIKSPSARSLSNERHELRSPDATARKVRESIIKKNLGPESLSSRRESMQYQSIGSR